MNEGIPGSFWVQNSARWSPGAPLFGLSWLVDGTLPGHLPPATFPASWFFSVPNGGKDQSHCFEIVAAPKEIGKLAEQFLNNEYEGLTTQVKIWDFERNLLSVMIRFPLSFPDNAIAQEYYDSRVDTEVWRFAKAENMLHEAFGFPDDQQVLLDQHQAAAQAKSDSLAWVELAEGIDSTTIDAVLQSIKTRLLSESAALAQTIASLQAEIRAQQLANLPAVSTFIEALPEGEIWQQYYKTVLRLQTSRTAGQAWTDQDSVALRLAAYDCPQIGGQAVSVARGMLPAPEAFNFVWEGEDSHCDQDRERQVSPALVTSWSVWPNPAQNQLLVQFNEPFTGKIELFSPTGKLLLSKLLIQASQVNLAVSTFPNGLYLLRCSDPYRSTLKVSIVH